MAITFTPTYLSWDDFKTITIVPAMASILEPEYDALAQRAELLIDNYVGRQEKYDSTQNRVFPRSCDIDTSGNPEIPEQVQIATARIVETLYKDGETKSPSQNSLKGEKIGDYSYTKDSSSSQSKGLELISPEAMSLLSDFKRRSVQISPPNVSSPILRDGQLNSRQKFVKYNRNC